MLDESHPSLVTFEPLRRIFTDALSEETKLQGQYYVQALSMYPSGPEPQNAEATLNAWIKAVDTRKQCQVQLQPHLEAIQQLAQRLHQQDSLGRWLS